MIAAILQLATVIDGWLHRNLGRPYMALLGIGLILGLVDNISSLDKAFESQGATAKIVVVGLFQLALLINQLSQFQEYRQARLAAREARRMAKEAAKTKP